MADELDDVPLSPTRPTAESTLVLDGTQKFRTRPLALVYSAKEDRKQFENRLNDWRLELSENINKPQKEWSQPWRPPYPPHHLLGDPQTQYDRANYIAAQAERATSLSAQAVTVQLKRLQDQLPVCQTAEQAVGALQAIVDFLEAPGNLYQIDAKSVLNQVRRTRLPFERLVRNVWQEGPEVQYDRWKATLSKLLQKEVQRRKEPPPPPPPPPKETTIAGDSFEYIKSTTRPKKIEINNTSYGVRSGLLTFAGDKVERPRKKRPTE